MTATPLQGLARIPLDDLRPSPNNPRQRLKDIDDLALSIRENGLIQPIVVQQIAGTAGYQVIAGHRRLAALQRLSRPDALCIIRKDMPSDAELVAMLVENGQRAGLDPIEEARALSRLRAQGMTQAEMAMKIGRSTAHVSMRLALLALPIEQQEELRAGEATVMASVEAARLASGRLPAGRTGKKPAAHLAFTHPLADRAKARCRRLSHKRGGSASVGGTACGECWESVIRADEREHLHDVSATQGKCVLCDTPQPDTNPMEQSA
jgi:ParB family transcriptional regulator, chromosome partitioning protein